MDGSPQDLLRILERIKYVIGQIDTGAGFMEDRGFGWTIELERREGIDDIRALFDTRPELRTLLPTLATLLADRSRVIGFENIPHNEVKAAIRQVKREIRNDTA